MNDMFQPSYNRYNTTSQMILDIHLPMNIGQETISFDGPKIRTKLSCSTKNVTTTAFFTDALKGEIFTKLHAIYLV